MASGGVLLLLLQVVACLGRRVDDGGIWSTLAEKLILVPIKMF